MPLDPGALIYVHVAPHQNLRQAVTHYGAYLLEVHTEVPVFLPAQEYPPGYDTQALLHALRDQRTMTVRVMEQSFSQSGEWLVSCREVEPGNPWQNTVLTWKPGVTIQSMRVTNVHAEYAYGEIIPGVQGKASLSDLIKHRDRQGNIHEGVLVGDYLEGYVDGFSYGHRLVLLDVARYIRTLDAQKNLPVSLRPPSSSSRNNHDSSNIVIQPSVNTVLVVDDDPLHLQAVVRCLEEDHLDVLSADSATVALEHVKNVLENEYDANEGSARQEGIDIAIVDIRLGNAPLGGLLLARDLQTKSPETKVLLMSGNTDVHEQLAEGDTLGIAVHGFVAKPFGPRRLRAAIAAAIEAAPISPIAFSPTAERFDIPAHTRKPGSDRTIKQCLGEFRTHVGAKQVALFSIHPISLLTTLVEGDAPNPSEGHDWAFWRHKLRYSPVRDVAIDHQPLHESNAVDSPHSLRHRWLQRAYNYRSCIGVPVRVEEKESYSLFAFHVKSCEFSAEHQIIATRYAAELAALIERERLLNSFETEMRYVTAGLTLYILGHELNSLLGAASLDAERVATLTRTDGTTLTSVRTSAEGLRDAVRQASAIAQLFIEAARKGRVQPVYVRECIDRAIRFAQPRLAGLNIQFGAGTVPTDLVVQTERVALEQVLYNLFMNAAEHSQQFRQRQRGATVSAQRTPDNPQQVQIIVQDNGPGIHHCWWEQIFSAGFTTKKDGSGLGLYICRRLLEGLGGSIKVLASTLWVGTTFVITLPAAPPKETEHGA